MPLANLLLCLALALSGTAATASKRAYDVDPKVLEVGTDRWMKDLPDDLPLHAISIPGTHDSLGTDHEFAHDSQGASLATQLDLGIRAVDLSVNGTRLKYLPGGRTVEVYFALDDNLYILAAWLAAHPSETVLVRVDGSLGPARMTEAMTRAWNDPAFAPFFWRPGSSNPAIPALGAVRGKMVLIQGASIRHMNLSFTEVAGNDRFRIQNRDHLATNWALYDKWVAVKTFLASTAELWPGGSAFSTNSLHGWGGSAAYFVASGNITWATGSPNLATGFVSRYGNNGWEDFPRSTCTFDEGFCWIMFEGVNPLTQTYIETARPNHVGIVRADFPGRGLINAIVDLNRSTAPPVQLTWGDTDRCVDVRGGVWNGTTDIVSNRCDAKSSSQQWLFAGDGLVRSFADPRRCVTAGAGQSRGSRLVLMPCEPRHSPHFLRTASNHLALDAAPQLCMEPMEGRIAQGTPIQLGTCVATAERQSFVAKRTHVPLVAGDRLCLELVAQQAMAATRSCTAGLDRQQWMLAEDGTLRSALAPNGCIVFRPEDPARSLVNEYCDPKAPQYWEARPDGTLRPRTLRIACLTLSEKGGAGVEACRPGAVSQRFAFHRDPVQLRWHENRCLAVNSQPAGADRSVMARPCSVPGIDCRTRRSACPSARARRCPRTTGNAWARPARRRSARASSPGRAPPRRPPRRHSAGCRCPTARCAPRAGPTCAWTRPAP
jgi:1-phosphatidylinositol phosphodiesterase